MISWWFVFLGVFLPSTVRGVQVKMLEAEREYECTNPRCQFHFKVVASLEQDNTMEMPVCVVELGRSRALEVAM